MFQPLADGGVSQRLEAGEQPGAALAGAGDALDPMRRSRAVPARGHGFTAIGLKPSGTRCSPITK